MGLGDFESPTGYSTSSGLPNLLKPFQLYVHERKGIGLGVLTQTLGGHPQPIAYLSVK